MWVSDLPARQSRAAVGRLTIGRGLRPQPGGEYNFRMLSAVPRSRDLTRSGLICLLISSAHGQSAEAPVIRMDVRQVLVPVVVTDSKGHHVTGLKASDFQILEDGVLQEIAAFSTGIALTDATLGAAPVEPSAAEAAPRTAMPAVHHPATSTFVVCVDAVHSAFVNSARTRETLTRLFEKEKDTGARYVLMSIGRQIRVLQTATADPAAVVSSLRGPAMQPALGGGDAATLTSELNDLKRK